MRLSGAAGSTLAPRGRTRPRSACVVAGIAASLASTPATAASWHFGASASLTETYTSNANYSASELAQGDFVTTVAGTVSISGESARLKVNGSLSASFLIYASETQNNSFAPQANISATWEAIEGWGFIDARASISQSFVLPFGPQPPNLVNATQNRYTQQSYEFSPYIKGVVPDTKLSYQVRDDNFWSVASSFGGSSTNIPTTYSNNLNASITSSTQPVGWTLEYSYAYYDNGLPADTFGSPTSSVQTARLIVPYQIDPQVQVSGRLGFQKGNFQVREEQSIIYGAGLVWNPTDRTNVNGYWEHQFFGSSYQASVSHRLPNASLSASFNRGLTSYPQLALVIPAGASVSQFIDAAFTTRIPDPTERQTAVQNFLANSGLPPSLVSPTNFYATTFTVTQSAIVSLALIGAFNSITFSIFNTSSENVSGSGNVLPPQLQFGQDNTQTGGGISYSHRLTAFTNLGANVSVSNTKSNITTPPFAGNKSENYGASVFLGTQFGPKTNGSAGVAYSQSKSVGSTEFFPTSSSINIYATISHNF